MAVAAFGEIVTVLMRSPAYRSYSISDLEWLVTPAVLNRQFSLVHLKDKKAGPAAPVALVMWASVSAEVEQRLLGELGAPIRLSPKDRKSGQLHWITDAVGDPRIVSVVLQNLRKVTLRGAPVKTVTREGTGKAQVILV
jgi:hemolysin-activating ACP:hemolysin acyltransferase